jgi:alpha-L-fucosidase 2
VGNGRLGAMVFGGTSRERLQLNEETLWSGGPYDPVNPEARGALAEVRRLIFAGEYEKASRLVDARVLAKPSGQMAYQSMGDLRLVFPGIGAASDYRRELDLDGAIATTRFSSKGVTHHRQLFASAPDNVLVFRISAAKPHSVDVDMTFRWPPRSRSADPPGDKLKDAGARSAGPVIFDDSEPAPTDLIVRVLPGGDLIMQGRNATRLGVPGALTYEARARVITAGGTRESSESSISVRGADSVIVLIAMATSYRDYQHVDADPTALNQVTLDRATDRSFDELLARHQTDHRRLFRRAQIDLGWTPAAERPTDERVRTSLTSNDPALAALYFQYGRYLLIASSRPGTQPANLQGIWNDMQDPPWGSKYTININTQMNYWPAEPTDLGECVEPLIAMVRDLSITGAKMAKAMYGARGWVAHHNTDLWRATGPIDGARYGMWPMGGAWLCLHLWDHYDYNRDAGYLATVYPLLKGACEFFLDTLVEHPNGRWLVTNPSMSPENEHRLGVAIAAGPAMDNQILRDLFANPRARR